MDWSNIVNSIGLLLDIIGAGLIYLYGLPKWVVRDGEDLVLDGGNAGEEEKTEPDYYTRRNKLGLIFLIAGFAFQLVSNFIAAK